jgi:hypothetical protein
MLMLHGGCIMDARQFSADSKLDVSVDEFEKKNETFF